MKVKMIFLLLIVSCIISCSTKNNSEITNKKQNTSHLKEEEIQEFEAFKSKRDSMLRAENGYVNLVGLYWLQEGKNSFGSDSSNTIIFPKNAPDFMGTFTLNLKDSTVNVSTIDGLDMMVDSNIVKNITIDQFNNQPVMSYKGFQWFVIERAGNIGIRLRDLDFPATKKPLNSPFYELSNDWVITATYQTFDTPKIYKIDNILGHSFEEKIEGKLIFNKEGKTYKLLPLISNNGMFIMFADGTSGVETYGAGRYLSADLPNENGKVVLNFNKAVNPPCAFTDYATCPLPMLENILELEVKAGEKYQSH